MKNLRKTLKILFIFGIILILGMEFLCSLGIKCKNCGEISSSKNESIRDGFYLGEYEALTKKIKLKNHDLEIEFSDAWYEIEWFINSNICLFRHKELRKEEYNIIFPFQKSKENVFLFTMKPIINGSECISCGGIKKNKKQISISSIPDTIEILIKEKNPKTGIGWSKGGLEGERIKYVRK